jgi:hypothetical protein
MGIWRILTPEVRFDRPAPKVKYLPAVCLHGERKFWREWRRGYGMDRQAAAVELPRPDR